MGQRVFDLATLPDRTKSCWRFNAGGYANRAKNAFLYPGSAWHNPVLGEPDADYMLVKNGGRMLDVRTYYFYFATIHTPAMLMKMIGAGSQ